MRLARGVCEILLLLLLLLLRTIWNWRINNESNGREKRSQTISLSFFLTLFSISHRIQLTFSKYDTSTSIRMIGAKKVETREHQFISVRIVYIKKHTQIHIRTGHIYVRVIDFILLEEIGWKVCISIYQRESEGNSKQSNWMQCHHFDANRIV